MCLPVRARWASERSRGGGRRARGALPAESCADGWENPEFTHKQALCSLHTQGNKA